MTPCTDFKPICADYAYKSNKSLFLPRFNNASVSFSRVHEKEFSFYLHF